MHFTSASSHVPVPRKTSSYWAASGVVVGVVVKVVYGGVVVAVVEPGVVVGVVRIEGVVVAVVEPGLVVGVVMIEGVVVAVLLPGVVVGVVVASRLPRSCAAEVTAEAPVGAPFPFFPPTLTPGGGASAPAPMPAPADINRRYE